MNKNNNSVENTTFVANISELGVKVEVSSLQSESTQQTAQPETSATPSFRFKTAQQRKDALAAAGIDVSKYFAMGSDMLVRMNVNGEPEQVTDDDPIFQRISSQGYIGVYKLFRRWVMAQMFELMESEYTWYQDRNLTGRIRFKGYEYSWSMLVNELYAQMKMAKNGDDKNYKLRSLWFNRSLALTMANDYMEKLEEYINHLPQKNCNKYKYHQKYITLRGRNVFVEDLEAQVWRELRGALNELRSAWRINDLYEAVAKFNKHRVKLDYNTPQCEDWIQAFKGAGAYWTAQNLIMFHRCRVHNSNTPLTTKDSMDALDKYNVTYAHTGEGWRLIGFLKKLMDDNHIDIAKKRAEWREDKKNR